MSRPPGPGALELLNLARRSKGDTPRMFQWLVARYGDVVAAGAGPARFFLLAHPDQIEQVLETHADRFERVAGERRVSGRLVGDSLFSSEGRAHAWERSVMEPVMYGAAAQAMAGHVTEMGARLRDRLVAGREVELFDLMERFSTDLIVKILFGEDPASGRGATISRAFTGSVAAMDHLPIGFSRLPEVLAPTKRAFHAARMRLDAAIADVVAERRASPGEDLLSSLISARDERGTAMSDLQLRNELVTLYRGHQAVSTALTYTWWQLAQLPEIEAAVLAEIDALRSDDPTFEDLPELTVTRMAFQETLRLYPPAWVLARKAIVPHEAGGTVIPAGARVLVSEWVTHRDPRFWDEPLAFRPERFTPEAETARPRYAYFPQGGGPKMCMGRHFVVPMEAPLLLASVGRRWRFRPVPGRPVEFAARATLKPKRGVYVTAEPR